MAQFKFGGKSVFKDFFEIWNTPHLNQAPPTLIEFWDGKASARIIDQIERLTRGSV